MLFIDHMHKNSYDKKSEKRNMFLELFFHVKHIFSKEKSVDILSQQKKILMPKEFIEMELPKHHSLKNYILWFFEKINLYKQKEKITRWKKWNIYYINFGINIGSEINGIRPAIIFENTRETYGKDIIVLPLTTDKKVGNNHFDIPFKKDIENGLRSDSLVKTRQIRCISIKRIQKYIGRISNTEYQEYIEKKVLQLFDIKNPTQTNPSGSHTS